MEKADKTEFIYEYKRKRKFFGRQTLFEDHGPNLIVNITPNQAMFKNYILRNPVHVGIQNTGTMSEHWVNSVRAEYTSSGVNHVEGGWPKDINTNDPEATQRYRRKIEKDDAYIHAVMHLGHSMEHNILQNNAVDMYQTYYSELSTIPPVEKSSCHTVNVYREPGSARRPIRSLSWQPDGARLASAHADINFTRSTRNLQLSYIWDIENANAPELVITPTHPLLDLQYNPRDQHILVGGLMNGQVGCWDMRKGGEAVILSPPHVSHRDLARNVLFINSKTGAEFFSSSPDGVVKWWDIRNMNEASDTMIIDPVKTNNDTQSVENALGISALEYEPTIPTRFMVGTETGLVIGGNRKGKTPLEKLPSKSVRMPRSSFPSSAQLDELLERLKEKRFLATGYARTTHARDYSRAAWQEIADKLNSHESGCIKNWQRWSKYWKDKKAAVKRKATQIRMAKSKTDGEAAEEIFLTAVEEKILAIMSGKNLGIFNRKSIYDAKDQENTSGSNNILQAGMPSLGAEPGTAHLQSHHREQSTPTIPDDQPEQPWTYDIEIESKPNTELLYEAHLGPVYALQRNPTFLKNFLTVGDWTARVWSEDCRESSVLWTCSHKTKLTDGAWNPIRFSLMLVTQWDGCLSCWDLLRRRSAPIVTAQLCDEPLLKLRPHEWGVLVACGSSKGTIYLAELSQNLGTADKNDKQLLTHILERENKRERILEARMREIRLKMRQDREGDTHPSESDAAITDKDLQEATAEYKQTVTELQARQKSQQT